MFNPTCTALTGKAVQAASSLGTWYALDEVGDHCAEVSSNILEDLGVFVVLCLQQHPGEVHILQEESAQGEGVTLQSSVCTEEHGGAQ